MGHEVAVVGNLTGETCDYPDPAYLVGGLVSRGEVDRGILLCGSGIGMSIAANKIKGVRAALVHDELTAEMSRSHNDANVICLSADLLGQRLIEKIVDIWLTTGFSGGRHERRVKKIAAIEEGRDPSGVAAG
jgi:ribose 5-phosphate isomerase B